MADEQSFQASGIFAELRGNKVAEIRVDASRIVHRAGHADVVEALPLLVMWQVAGKSRVVQGPRTTAMEAGTWTLCDCERDLEVDFAQGARCVMLLLPREQCGGWVRALSALPVLALPGGGPAHIAMAILAAMLRDVTRLDAASEVTMYASVHAFIDRALTAELQANGWSSRSPHGVQLSQVQAYVRERLADHALTISRIAEAFGMSRRCLYNVFMPLGITPRAYIQNAKLDRACELLEHPTWRSQPMAQIAKQCGFTDPAHFSRAFHARHGTAPSAWRRERV